MRAIGTRLDAIEKELGKVDLEALGREWAEAIQVLFNNGEDAEALDKLRNVRERALVAVANGSGGKYEAHMARMCSVFLDEEKVEP